MSPTGEFGAAFTEPADLLAVHASMIGALGLGCLVLLTRRRQVVGILRTFFAAEASPLDLAVLRIMVCLGLWWNSSLPRALFFSEFPPGLMFPPYGSATLLALVPVDPRLVLGAGLLLHVCLVAGAIGFFTRPALLGAAVLATYVLGVPQFFGKVNHHNHLVWFAALLAASDAGAALSVDAVRRAWRRDRFASTAVPGPSRAYGMPLRVAQLLIGILYFFPGFWKLWISGTEWFLGENLRNTMYNFWFLGLGTPVPALAASHALLVLVGLGVIAVETGFLFLIVFPRTRPVAVAAGLLFHLGTGVALNVWFASLVFCYVVFVDWAALGHAVVRRCIPARMAGVRRAWVLLAGEAGRPAAAPGSPLRPVLVAVSALLVAGAVYTGARALVAGWPFACYPIFAPVPEARVYELRVVAVGSSGEELAMSTAELRARMGRERYARLVQRIGATEDEALRASRAAALLAVWQRAVGLDGDRRSFRAYLETHGTLPGDSARNPLTREELVETSGSRGGPRSSH